MSNEKPVTIDDVMRLATRYSIFSAHGSVNDNNRSYEDLRTAVEAYGRAQIVTERERITALLAAIRSYWVTANGKDSMSVSALDQISEVISREADFHSFARAIERAKNIMSAG